MGFLSRLLGQKKHDIKVSKKQLTEDFIKYLTTKLPNVKATIKNANSPDNISINIERAEGDPITFYPDNLYQVYEQQNENFIHYRDNITRSISELINTQKEIEVMLLPAIKTMSWVNHVNNVTSSQPTDQSLIYLPLAGELVIVFALDMGNSMSFLMKNMLANYSSTLDIHEVYKQSIENFQDIIQEIELQKTNLGYMVKLDDNYEASLVLLIDQLLSSVDIEGEPVIAIIARNQLFIADSKNHQQVSDLRQYALDQIDKIPYALSSHLFCVKDKKLVPYHVI